MRGESFIALGKFPMRFGIQCVALQTTVLSPHGCVYKIPYLSNLTLHNNHFLAKIKSKSPTNTEIMIIFHHIYFQWVCLNFSSEGRGKAALTVISFGIREYCIIWWFILLLSIKETISQ